MGFRLIRSRETFYELFERVGKHLVEGAGLLSACIEPGANRRDLAEQMRAAESRCDETTHTLIRKVNSTFVTPFDREDIFRLAGLLDDVMDQMDQAVDQIVLYDVDELPTGCADQVEVLQQAAALTAEAMAKLESMEDLQAYWIEVNRLENQGDRSYRRILVSLFGGDYQTMDVLKLKDVAGSLEQAIDAFESVANAIEQIVVKGS